ncbi:MAG: MarR family transcriptional regulator [Thermoleophilia bacterium]|nr:MarR family transcriptional regulator [Thermoleophilia bacterium]
MVIPVPPENARDWHPIPLPDDEQKLDESILEAFLEFQKAVDLHQRLVLQNLCDGGTQPAQVTLLRVVATYPGLSQREIADMLGLSRARVTRILQGLEDMGAIKRIRDDNDQRVTRVYLTETGKEIDASKEALRLEHINLVFGSLSEKERKELRRSLSAVSRAIQGLIRTDGKPGS